MIVFDQLLADAFESYAGSQPIDWINRYASAHGCKVNSALIKLGADNSGFTLFDHLRYDQLFNQSSVSKAFAHFLADSKDEIERLASFDLLETEANYSDWLSDGHDARVVPTYIEMQRHIHRVNKPVRVAFFEMMLGCAADYAQAFNRAVHQLVDKASSNAIASSDFQEAKIIQRLRDAIALAGSAEKLDSAFQTIASQQQTIGLLVSQQAPAQQQAGQMPTKKPRAKNDTPDYLKIELKRIYDYVINKKPAGVIAEIERLCRSKSSGWKLDANTSVAVFSCDCPSCYESIFSKKITLSSRNISKVCRDFR